MEICSLLFNYFDCFSQVYFQSFVFVANFQPIISLLISCSHEALSQMSTSVVEVWQPEDADPLVPLQVIIIYFLRVFVSMKRI